MREAGRQQTPSPVAGREPEPPQGGEVRARWAWVEASVWTPRMLRTLETGMEGGKWFRLIDKVWSEKNLHSALKQVINNGGSAGVDGRSVAAVERQSEEEIAILHRQLRAESYEPKAVKRVWIPKQGSAEKRPLGVPTVRDRVVQTALRNVIEPIFERDFAPQSYGFRPGRGCKDALRRVDQLLKEGRVWVVDADIKSYFDTIPHGPLLERVGRKIADGKVLRLIEGYLKAGVMESIKDWQPTDQGTPQGAVVSPLLANVYLDPLDWEMAAVGLEMVRYADDCAPRARGANREVRLLARNCATDEGKKAPRDLLAGAGLKSPSAAVVKSHGGEHKKEKAREEPGQMRQEEVERK